MHRGTVHEKGNESERSSVLYGTLYVPAHTPDPERSAGYGKFVDSKGQEIEEPEGIDFAGRYIPFLNDKDYEQGEWVLVKEIVVDDENNMMAHVEKREDPSWEWDDLLFKVDFISYRSRGR